MIALLASELLRARSRRLVKVLAILSGIGIALSTFLVAVNSDPADPFGYRVVPDILTGLAFIFVIIGWYMGASFVGAEWAAGTMATTITWESRRGRVLVAKAVAAAGSVFVFMMLVCGLMSVAFAMVASATDPSAMPAGFIVDQTSLVLRLASASAIGGLLGFSVATVARHTAGAVGVGFGYLLIVEGLLRAFRPGWQRLLLGENLAFWVIGHGRTSSGQSVSMTGSGLVLVGYCLVLFAIALAWFRARDVN